MRNFVLGIVFTGVLVAFLKYCEHRKDTSEKIREVSVLLEKQINNVGKLIVTEGHFSEVFTYEDSKNLYFDLVKVGKKALVVVNAEVLVSYDLRELKVELDQETQTVRIQKIPPPEMKIFPELEYYDIQQDFLNTFKAEDYNKIKNRVTKQIEAKIVQSPLLENAQNRLLSELSHIYLLTESMGWILVYQEKPIETQADLQQVLP